MNRYFLIFSMMFTIIAGTMSKASADDACSYDRSITCNDITAGEGRQYDCLVGRVDKVKPECAKALDRADQLANQVVTACKPDVQRWCAQFTGEGRARIVDCLKSNKDKVTEDCKRRYRQFQSFGFDIRS